MQYSPEADYIIRESKDLASQKGQSAGSLHLFMAFFILTNTAEMLLKQYGLSEDDFLPLVKRHRDEPDSVMEIILRKAQETTGWGPRKEMTALHLLIAITRVDASCACRILKDGLAAHNVTVPELRTTALAYLSGNMPRSYQNLFAEYHQRRMEMRFQRSATSEPASCSEQDEEYDETPSARPGRASDSRDRSVSAPVTQETSRSVAPSTRGPAAGEAEETAARQGRRAIEAAAARRRSADASPAADLKQFELPLPKTSLLAELTTNLSLKAARGEFDPLIGRDQIINELLDVLGKRRSNNPCLVGDPGVGKTAVVEGLAQRLVQGGQSLPGFDRPVVLSLEVARIMSGTQYRGVFAEKMQTLRDEVARLKDRVIIFIDELHTIAMHSAEGSAEIARELKDALSRGLFPCIGATTREEYRQHIANDPALARRFQVIEVPEPSLPETRAILSQVAPRYQEHHSVVYQADALEAALSLAERYLPERRFPDKAINLIDLAGSRAAREQRRDVVYDDVARLVSSLSGVPLDQISLDPSQRLDQMESLLNRWVVGHPEVIKEISAVVRRHYAGFSDRRPVGSFLFLGPTGVGKTETAKALCRFLFGKPDAMVRLDMSEFSEAHTVARLIGAPPGYVGYEAGGQLTEAVRLKPFQVVLFDEVEKAHPDVWKVFLQLLDEGHLTDGRGNRVSFTNTVIIMTSNLGADLFVQRRGGLGFGGSDADAAANRAEAVLAIAKERIPPELWNRIDEKLVFEPLTRDHLADIVLLLLDETRRRLEEGRDVTLHWDESAVRFLLDKGYDPAYGARPLRRAIQMYLEAPLANLIVAGQVVKGDHIDITLDNDGKRLSFTAWSDEDEVDAAPGGDSDT